MNRLNPLFANIIASAFIWVTMGLVALFASDNDSIMILGLLTALGSSVALWLVWAFTQLDESKNAVSAEKAKRSGAGDTNSRLALLLELMDEDERQQLKRRLLDEMHGSDGESVALADLLADQDARSRRA